MMPGEDRVEMRQSVISAEFDVLRKEIAILQEQVSGLSHLLIPVCGPDTRMEKRSEPDRNAPEREKSNFAEGLHELAIQIRMIRETVESTAARVEI